MFDVGYAGRYRIDPSCPIVVAGLEKDCVDVACAGATEGLAVFGLIDCGDNIELFKALAAMNNENDMDQWFICQKNKNGDMYFRKCTITCITEWYYLRWYYLCRKAAAEEIIKHFKK